jgi:hypothetical protein
VFFNKQIVSQYRRCKADNINESVSGGTRSAQLGMRNGYKILVVKTDASEDLDVTSSAIREAEDRS